MSPLKVKNGKLLTAGNELGFSSDCGCCDRPATCFDCCPFPWYDVRTVAVSLTMTLPSVSFDMTYGGVTAKRVVPGATLSGNGVVLFWSSSSGSFCYLWRGFSDAAYSNYTWASYPAGYAEQLGISTHNFNVTGKPECYQSASLQFYLNTDIEPFNGEDITLSLTTPETYGGFPARDYFALTFGSGLVQADRSFCITEDQSFPVTFSRWQYFDSRAFVRPELSNVLLPAIGTNYGTLTITGIE